MAEAVPPCGHTDLAGLLEWLSACLPAGSSHAGGPIGDEKSSRYAQEEMAIANAVPKRRSEFRAGRRYARAALAGLGCPDQAILPRPGRDPAWPDGYVGSITHSAGAAIAVAAPEALLDAIGIDLESDAPLAPDLARMICRPEEMGPEPELARRGIDPGKLRFVAKEAVYKAIFPRSRRILDFRDAIVTFDAGKSSFRFTLLEDRLPGPPERRRYDGVFFAGDGWLACLSVMTSRAG